MNNETGASAVVDDRTTVICIGVLAASLAAIVHEAIGHGLGCVAVGGHVTLLTSIWFRCRGATSVTDAGGPIASLVVGVAALLFVRKMALHPVARFYLLVFGALSLFWFAAQLIEHPIADRDDWAFIAHRMGWPEIWRPIMVAIGITAYVVTIRWIATILRSDAPSQNAIRVAYGGAVCSAVIAGLMWRPMPIRSAIEAFLTLGIAPLGLLVANQLVTRSPQNAQLITRSWLWIAVSACIFCAFLFVQAPGLG